MKQFTSLNIISTVADVYNISVDEMLERNREPWIVEARYMAAYLMRKHILSAGPVFIASELGIDYSTVCYGIKHIKGLMEVDKNVRRRYNDVIDRL